MPRTGLGGPRTGLGGRRTGLGGAVLLALVLAGCAVPSWVPLVGKKEGPPPVRSVAPGSEILPAPVVGQAVTKPATPDTEETITDRIVAIVNNDAITLAELPR